jgi:hypothetical protein
MVGMAGEEQDESRRVKSTKVKSGKWKVRRRKFMEGFYQIWIARSKTIPYMSR